MCEGFADGVEVQAAGCGDIYGLEFILTDYVEVEVQNKFAGVGVGVGQRVGGGFPGACCGDLFGGDVAQRGLRQNFLFGRVEACDAVKKDVGLADERGFAPEADEFGSTATDDVGDDHAVDAAGGCGGGSVQVGVAVEPDEIEMFVVAARAGEQTDGLSAVAAENEDESAAFHGDFGVDFEIVETGYDCGEVAGAAMFVIVGEEALGAVAVVMDFEASGFEAIDQTSGAKCGGGFFAAGLERGGAGRRADQGNLLRLTDDFDRQSMTPCDVFPAVRLRLRLRCPWCFAACCEKRFERSIVLVGSTVLRIALRSFAPLRMTTA